MTANEYKVYFKGNESVFKLDCDDSCTTVNILKTIEWYTLNG